MYKNKYKFIVLTVVVLIIVGWAIAAPFRVTGDGVEPGDCMEPAVKDGQLCFVNRIAPYLRKWQRNDIIVLNYENKVWVARILALENETIQITEGSIIVNGTPLQESIQRNWTEWNYGTYALNEPFKVPSDHVYVLSDNLSAHHDDSRVFGPIPKQSIVGLVW
jgi:signal peptidase I